jgi:hypothetical protein
MAKIHPSLADGPSDVSTNFPPDLLAAWASSARTPEEHLRLLAPYRVQGTFVFSDSAGLSKLAKSRPLVEVLKLISEPKEVVFKYGSAIGGVPIGTWVADNTQMFYPATVPVATVVAQMLAAQQALSGLTVKIGIGIGCTGTDSSSTGDAAYFIERGLYGRIVDDIEGEGGASRWASVNGAGCCL